jgi:hypothetical protein
MRRSKTIPQSGRCLPISPIGEQVIPHHHHHHHHRWYIPVSRTPTIRRAQEEILRQAL